MDQFFMLEFMALAQSVQEINPSRKHKVPQLTEQTEKATG